MKNTPLIRQEAHSLLLRAQEHRRASEEGGATDGVALWRAELAVRAAIVLRRIIHDEPDNAVIEACADVSAGAARLRIATRENAFATD